MECEDVRKQLEAYLEGEIGENEREAIQGHLTKCPECARAFCQSRKLAGVLQSWKAEEPPEDLYERLKSSLESRESRWKRMITPAFAGKAALRFAEIAAVIFITLAVSRHFQKPAAAPPDDDLATINLYMTEHQEAVLQTASVESVGPRPARVTLSRDDIMYYEYIDADRQISRPGVILRGPKYPQETGPAASDSGFSSAKSLTLSQASKAVSFEPVAPSRIHPGYILDTITKVTDRESLHLLYTNGIDTFSVFEQPLGGKRGLAAKEFREYAVYKSSGPEVAAADQAGTTILAWKNTHVSFVLIGRADMSRLMEIAQAFTEARKGVNEFGE